VAEMQTVGLEQVTARSRDTQKARAAAQRQLSAQANFRASLLLPIIEDLNVAGITSMRDVAAALNKRDVGTARGGRWSARQVKSLMKRIQSKVQ
jgi:hypothetical protein